MIPKQLIIQGIYSYQEKQEIDFQKLTESQLFGVFGAVGSGKSTLLEAISFALYGKTERLGSQDNLKYNMMNLKSDMLFIDFEFENYDTKKYKFIVEGKRSSKRFDDVRTFQRRAFVQENEKWIPLDSTSVESIIGLSYDNFRRTIIIPQGKFQEFLQLKDKDRTEMLKEIFNLSKFDYFYQIASLGSINDKAKEKLNGQLLHYEALTKDSIELASKNYNNLVRVNLEKKKELDLIKIQEKSLNLLRESFNNLSVKRQELIQLNSKSDVIKAKEKTYVNYEYVLINFKDRIVQLEKLKLKEITTNEKRKNESSQLYLIKEQVKLKKETERKLKIELDKIPQSEKEIKDLELILKINDSAIILKENDDRLTKGRLFLKNLAIEIESTEKNIRKLTEELLVFKKQQLPTNLDEFTELLIWFKEYELILEGIKKVKKDEQQDLAIFNNKKDEIINQFKGIELKEKLEDIDQINVLIEKEKKELEKLTLEEQILIKSLTDFKVKQELEKWSNQIEEGKPCPLCGALEHPEIMNSESMSLHVSNVERKIEELKVKQDLITFNLLKINELRLLFESREERILTLNKLKEIKELDLKSKQKTFGNKSYSIGDVLLVKNDFEKFKKQEKALTNLNNKIEEENMSLRSKFKKKEHYKLEFEKIELKTKTAQLEIKTYESQLVVLIPSNFNNNEEINEKIKLLKSSIDKTKINLEKIELELVILMKEQIVKEEAVKNLNKLLINFTEELNVENKLLLAELVKSPFNELEEITKILNSSVNIEELKKTVNDYKLEEHSLISMIKQLEVDLKDQSFDADNFKQLQNQILSKTNFLEQGNEERIKLENELIKAKADFKVKNELSKQLDKLEFRGDNIATLKSLFKGSGFVNYISSVYLQNLCNEANVRFYQLTRQQLKLEINDKNEFLVRDYMNEGKVRSVKTLSGGQLFQASLSLALALAESIQEQNKANQNFFFLDEGFGSQDKESLQIVFESLKALRKENRIVGVISHVEELQQEISTYLKIINHNDVGSKIKESWEGY